MISEKYLAIGLTGLGRIHKSNWDAHFPAAVLAGFYYSVNNRLPVETEREIEKQLDLLIATKTDLFEPYDSNTVISDSVSPIVEALEESIDKFSELGHNTIFASYAIKALKDASPFRSEKAVLDIASVIRQFNYGPACYWLKLSRGHDPRKFSIKERTIFTDNLSEKLIAKIIVKELPKFKYIYTQMGSKSHVGHLLTQSQSLIELKRLGLKDIANRGSHSLECRFILLKDCQEHIASERSFYKLATRSSYLPNEPEYWHEDFTQGYWDEGHDFKYTFSFFELINYLDDNTAIEKATEKFRYLVTPNEISRPT